MRAALMPRRRHLRVKAKALTSSLRRFGRCRYYLPVDLNQSNAENLSSLADIIAIRSGVSMRSGALCPALLAAAALAVASASPAAAAILVNIDKTTQSMTVTVDGAPRYIWPVSTGKQGYDTPNGTFRPNRMDADHLSQEWDNAPMPNTIFFDLHGHAIHGFLDTRRIGSAASHGCVRLAPENAAILYNLVETQGMKDTTVIVSGQTPAGSNPEMARRAAAERQAAAGLPMQIAPGNAQPGRRSTGGALRPTAAADIFRTTAVQRAADRRRLIHQRRRPGILASRSSRRLTDNSSNTMCGLITGSSIIMCSPAPSSNTPRRIRGIERRPLYGFWNLSTKLSTGMVGLKVTKSRVSSG